MEAIRQPLRIKDSDKYGVKDAKPTLIIQSILQEFHMPPMSFGHKIRDFDKT